MRARVGRVLEASVPSLPTMDHAARSARQLGMLVLGQGRPPLDLPWTMHSLTSAAMWPSLPRSPARGVNSVRISVRTRKTKLPRRQLHQYRTARPVCSVWSPVDSRQWLIVLASVGPCCSTFWLHLCHVRRSLRALGYAVYAMREGAQPL